MILRSQVLLVDHHPLSRAGLAVAIRREPDLEVAAEASGASEAVEVVAHHSVDIAIVPVLMPESNGISLAARLLDLQRDLRILALSTLDQPIVIAAMLRAGATGFAVKTQTLDEILGAIREVLRGTMYLPPHVPRAAVLSQLQEDEPRRLDCLTRRERDLFDLLIHGHSNLQIAGALCISRRTVETHRQRIMRKLGMHSILDLLRLAAREGVLVR